MLTVHIVGLPVQLRLKAQQHTEGLIRELTLIAEQMRRRGTVRELPVRLVELIERLSSRYSGLGDEQEQQFEDAYARGADTLDLAYHVPAGAIDATRALGQLLDEADEYCREGKHLLTLATPPELVAYRHWLLGEFTEQAAGRPPVPWAENGVPGKPRPARASQG